MSGMTGHTGRWEYHAEKHTAGTDLDVEYLNALGADRWELVTTMNGSHNQQALIFKRPTPTLAEQITLDQRARVQGDQRIEQHSELAEGSQS